MTQNSRDRQHDNGNENEDASPTLSNVMEGLINVAETVVASKSSANTENSGMQDLIPNEPLRNDSKNDEIEALKKKLEETQKAMQLIMAQVNKVSTEVNHTDETASDISTISRSNNKGPSENQNLVDNAGSEMTNISYKNQTLKSTIDDQSMNEKIPKEELYNL